MSSLKASKKSERNAFLTVLSIFAMGQIAGSIDAAIAYFSAVCVIIGGLVPFFVTNFSVLLVFRVIYGIGFGGMMSLENTFAVLTLPKENRYLTVYRQHFG